jgi:phage shock protein PspC (stress-responsive transcriptional regulator)
MAAMSPSGDDLAPPPDPSHPPDPSGPPSDPPDPSGPPSDPPDPPEPPEVPAERGRRRGPARSTDRYVGGVAGGVARALDVDPIVVRVALVVGVLYQPLLAVAYAVAWLVLPDERTGRTLVGAARTADGWRSMGGILALAAGVVLLAPDLGPGGNGGLTAGVLLAGIGALLVLRHPGDGAQPAGGGQPGGPGPAPAGPDPDDPDAGGVGVVVGGDRPGTEPLGGGARRGRVGVAPLERLVRERLQHRRRRPPAHLGWLGLSALVVLAALAAGVDRAITPVKPGVAVSLGLLLVGGVLLVAAWRGRARLLIPAGVALLPLWVGWSLTDVPRYDEDGNPPRYVVASRDELRRSYEHGFGDMEVDLTAVRLRPGEHRSLHLGLTAGRASLAVPGEAHLVIRGDVGIGRVEVGERPNHVVTADSGEIVAGEVDMRLGDPQPVCTEQPVFREPTIDASGAPVPPEVLGTEYRTRWGQPCEPQPPVEDPPVLEIVLDVGIGTVRVNREVA